MIPVVSIITPCHNGLPYLAEQLASVRSQTFAAWEHIVVDDGSSDGSMAVVETAMAREPRLRTVRQEQGGVARARKAGYALASPQSKYVYFLDADDVLEPDMLAVMVAYLDAHPEAGVAYCDYHCIDRAGGAVETLRGSRFARAWFGVRELPANEPRTPLEAVFAWAPVMESVSVIRRTAYDQTPGWDEMIGQPGEGVDLFTEIALRGEVHFVNRRLYRYRRHAEQASSDHERLTRQDLRIQRKWRDRRDLTPDERARIDAAQRFRMGPLRVRDLWQSGGRYLMRGEVGHGAHNYRVLVATLGRMLMRRSSWPDIDPEAAQTHAEEPA
jgi:glycosyltransferase involved in cell wall biosynthesis